MFSEKNFDVSEQMNKILIIKLIILISFENSFNYNNSPMK